MGVSWAGATESVHRCGAQPRPAPPPYPATTSTRQRAPPGATWQCEVGGRWWGGSSTALAGSGGGAGAAAHLQPGCARRRCEQWVCGRLQARISRRRPRGVAGAPHKRGCTRDHTAMLSHDWLLGMLAAPPPTRSAARPATRCSHTCALEGARRVDKSAGAARPLGSLLAPPTSRSIRVFRAGRSCTRFCGSRCCCCCGAGSRRLCCAPGRSPI